MTTNYKEKAPNMLGYEIGHNNMPYNEDTGYLTLGQQKQRDMWLRSLQPESTGEPAKVEAATSPAADSDTVQVARAWFQTMHTEKTIAEECERLGIADAMMKKGDRVRYHLSADREEYGIVEKFNPGLMSVTIANYKLPDSDLGQPTANNLTHCVHISMIDEYYACAFPTATDRVKAFERCISHLLFGR